VVRRINGANVVKLWAWNFFSKFWDYGNIKMGVWVWV
jgi:hypothetical protein